MQYTLRLALFFCFIFPLLAEKNVIIVSIDGLKGTTLASLPERRLKTPNLNQFVQSGAVSAGLVGVFPTVTYPSHTTLVTGTSPSKHGITGNSLFDPERKMNGAWYWYAQQIKVPALWDIAHQKGIRTASVSWPVTVGATIDANIPEYRFIRTEEDVMLLRALATPGLLSECEHADKALQPGKENDHDRTHMATHLLTSRKPGLLLVHLTEMDHEEHVYGPDSPEALKTLESIDDCIGIMRDAVKKAGLEKETIFVVTSDHGFLPVEKSFSPNAVLNSLGLLGAEQHPEQWRVAVHANGASFGLIAHNPNDKEAISIAQTMFRRLLEDGRYGFDQVYDQKQLGSMEGYPNSFLAVSLKSGYTVGGERSGSWLNDSPRTKGMHGHAPGDPQLDASFVAFGAGISARRLPRAKLVDVAPTVAHLLGFQMENVEGSDLLNSNAGASAPTTSLVHPQK